VLRLVLGFQKVRAHHRRQGQRNDQRKDQRYADGDRKFTEQQPDITAHQEQRDEDGDQRQRSGRLVDFVIDEQQPAAAEQGLVVLAIGEHGHRASRRQLAAVPTPEFGR